MCRRLKMPICSPVIRACWHREATFSERPVSASSAKPCDGRRHGLMLGADCGTRWLRNHHLFEQQQQLALPAPPHRPNLVRRGSLARLEKEDGPAAASSTAHWPGASEPCGAFARCINRAMLLVEPTWADGLWFCGTFLCSDVPAIEPRQPDLTPTLGLGQA